MHEELELQPEVFKGVSWWKLRHPAELNTLHQFLIYVKQNSLTLLSWDAAKVKHIQNQKYEIVHHS